MHTHPLSLRTAPPSTPSQGMLQGFSALDTRLYMGTQLFGTNASWLLIGFLLVQTYGYYKSPVKDRPLFQALVYSIVFIAIAQSAVEGYVAYSFLVSGWGNPLVSLDASPTLAAMSDLQLLFDGIPAIVVQFFFTWRIWIFCMAVLSGRKAKLFAAGMCLFIIISSISAFVAAIFVTVLFITASTETFTTFQPVVIVWTAASALTDLTITACMMTILRHAKAASHFGDTRDLISRLLRLTIQTGLLTSALAIPIAPLVFTDEIGIYSLTMFLIGKSYVISLLATLNARSYRTTRNLSSNIDGISDGSRIPAMAFNPNPNKKAQVSGDVTTSSTSVMSYVRSVARSIHHDLNTSHEDEVSQTEHETQSGNDGPPGLSGTRNNSGGLEEQPSIPAHV